MAIKTYKKNTISKLSTNFKSTEFDCHGAKCCSETLIDEQLVEYLQDIRDHFNKPVNISSAYRCATHNKNIGGATGSRHMKGQAADIYINGVKPIEIAKYAESIGVLGIGLYETDKDGHFVHIDTRTNKAFWYGQSQKPRNTFGGVPVENVSSSSKELYCVRKSWTDSKSQIGAYNILSNAKTACTNAGAGYYVFNSKGEIVYPEESITIDVSKINTQAIDAKIVWNFFKAQGLSDHGVAGLMGNLYAESGLRPCNLQNAYEKTLNMSDAQYTAAVDTGIYTEFVTDKAGYGIAQWTHWSLKEDLLEYCRTREKSIGDGQTQMEFLAYQLSTDYKQVWDTLIKTSDILEASNAVLLKFECPVDQSEKVQELRAKYGQQYYEQYASVKESQIVVPKESVNGQMKYSDSNKPIVCMQTQSTCYKGTSKMNVKGVLWHSTGANNPNLKRYVQPSDNAVDKAAMLDLLGVNKFKNDWNHIEHKAGLNCWIGKLADGTIATIQTMPWDYRPWGCGSGPKGSCNNGWIQFEICEDGLTDKDYFNKAYKEACELTAYLCKMYNIDPLGTVDYNGIKVPTILCHYDAHKLGLGSNHGDVDHWFPRHNKSMKTVREDVANLMGIMSAQPDQDNVYRVRKAWDDAQSQIGAYKTLTNAKLACDKAGIGYFVFDHTGECIYPEMIEQKFSVGDKVKLISGATYASGKAIPAWVFKSSLFARELRANGTCVISTHSFGPITGIVKITDLIPYSTDDPNFNTYIVRVTASTLNVRSEPDINSSIQKQIKQNELYTIIEEKDGWGKLKSGAGWIHLDYVKRMSK